MELGKLSFWFWMDGMSAAQGAAFSPGRVEDWGYRRPCGSPISRGSNALVHSCGCSPPQRVVERGPIANIDARRCDGHGKWTSKRTPLPSSRAPVPSRRSAFPHRPMVESLRGLVWQSRCDDAPPICRHWAAPTGTGAAVAAA